MSSATAPTRESSNGIKAQGLAPKGKVHWNLVAPELVAAALQRARAARSPETQRAKTDEPRLGDSAAPMTQFLHLSAFAEQMLPDAVGHHACGQRMSRIDDPTRQLFATADFVRDLRRVGQDGVDELHARVTSGSWEGLSLGLRP